MTSVPGPAAASLRAAGPGDRDLPFRIYASTREEELAITGWTDDERRAFLRMQFDAQDRHYRDHYADARFDVVLAGDEPAGRLYVQRAADEIRIIDIALLPAFRGRGLGTALLRAVLEEADEAHRPVTIHVEQHNPALRLYQRLGFEVRVTRGIYYLLERLPR